MKSLRTQAGQMAYDAYLRTRTPDTPCELCKREALASFTHWKIIHNDFPYDRVAEIHTMLVPYRHVIENDLTEEERKELLFIKDSQMEKYKYIIEATRTKKSIPDHLHFHLIALKDS